MKSEKVFEPLLYIEQPLMEKPIAHMQDSYQGKRLKEEKEVVAEVEEGSNDKLKKNNTDFGTSTVNEKITYLVNLPTGMPKVRSEITTSEGVYRGIIINEHDSEIELRVFGRENKVINREDIESINMIGF